MAELHVFDPSRKTAASKQRVDAWTKGAVVSINERAVTAREIEERTRAYDELSQVLQNFFRTIYRCGYFKHSSVNDLVSTCHERVVREERINTRE